MKLLLVIIIACAGSVLFLLPKATAQKRPLKEFMVKDTRPNYVVQRGRKDELLKRMDSIGPAYERRSYDSDYPGDLPELMVDYANMIRNDIILLDNSVEMQKRKRGNINKYNYAIPELPCSCKSSKDFIDLGSNHIPQYVESRSCRLGSCPPPYRCKEEYYDIMVLKLRTYEAESQFEVPEDLSDRWLAKQINVAVGCICSKDSAN